MIHVSTLADLSALRHAHNKEAVTLSVRELKYTGVLRMAMRRSLFALRPGGQLIIDDIADQRQGIEPFRFGWPTLRSLAFSSLSSVCSIVDQSTPGRLVFERTAPVLGPGWSAGIIFSGREDEIPQLDVCLQSLLHQKELSSGLGEILVCGPNRNLAFLARYPSVAYLGYEETDKDQFPIAHKKNHLMNHMRYPRKLVLHTRIVLDHGCLAHLPHEFDMIALNVQSTAGGRRNSDLGLIGLDPAWPDIAPTKFERTTRHVSNYFELYRRRRVYIDGGVFAVTQPVLDQCKPNPWMRWGDCEDVEWAFRAQALGFSVDMAPSATAVSTKNKTVGIPELPQNVSKIIRINWRAARLLFNFLSR